eukprot:TRINITY_DN37536_c0_g1_i2.p1 TRINITY_DN37536_c0_g1~~TRINITY_DN37536_c0_g1_i2.p1  ORF type:complete len:630 (+),score=163.70 TRINITY_DN37536_c0_g1_i2:147-2036(+)
MRLLLAEGGSLRSDLEKIASSAGSAGGAAEHSKAVTVLAGKSGVAHSDEESCAALAFAPGSASVPPLLLAVGAAACSSSCSLSEPLKKMSGMLAAGKTAHVLVLSDISTAARGNIAAALKGVTADVSISVPPSAVEVNNQQASETQLTGWVKDVMKDLGVKRFSMLWLPYDAFKKHFWPGVQMQLNAMIKAGTIGAYGIQTVVQAKSVLSKLLAREPAPAGLLLKQDFLRPVAQEVMEAAKEQGAAVVTLPRTVGAPGGAAATYLEAVGVGGAAAKEAAVHCWALKRGISSAAMELYAATADASTAVGSLAVLDALKELRLPSATSAVLESLQAFTAVRAAGDADAPQAEGSLGKGLQLVEELVKKDRDAQRLSTTGIPSKTDTFVPGINPEKLENLAEQKATFQKNGHLIYTQNMFDEKTFAAIVEETKRLWKSADLEPNCNLDGKDRMGGYVLDHRDSETSLYNLIYGNEAFRRWVSAINGEGEMWPSDFPVELREYGTESKGMGCHKDLKMYTSTKKDLEFAFTVDNLSKCNATFYDPQNTLQSVHTTPNSMFMLRPDGATHCVTPTEGGSRTLLKWIFVGDYRKSSQFKFYIDNACTDTNPNVQMVKARRESNLPGADGKVRLEV